MEPTLQFADINGAKLAYKILGDPSLPLFITLHGGRGFGEPSPPCFPLDALTGLPGSHGSDFTAYRPLADSYRFLSFDFRGHGQSSCTRPYTFAQLVDDIHGFREHFVGGDRAVICGGSFGGYLAQQYAITYPDYVSHLVLRGTAPSHEREWGSEFTGPIPVVRMC
jgi:pimeloyl-ACP methyl ester carboxylesterase